MSDSVLLGKTHEEYPDLCAKCKIRYVKLSSSRDMDLDALFEQTDVGETFYK